MFASVSFAVWYGLNYIYMINYDDIGEFNDT